MLPLQRLKLTKPNMRKIEIPLRYCETCGEQIPRNTKQGENRIRPSQYRKARFCSRACKGVHHSEVMKGKNNPNYKDGMNIVRELDRNSKRYKIWRKEVFLRDCYTCQSCGIKGGDMHAHHLKTWKNHEDARFDINNGVCLCVDCHMVIHNSK